MTLSELNNLSDEEVRIRAAEKMGIEVLGTAWTVLSDKHEPFGIKDGRDFIVPFFESDLNAAITLCDKMREEGWHCNLDRGAAKDDLWGCAFIQMEQEAPIWYPATSSSLPRAITLAFLMAQLNGN